MGTSLTNALISFLWADLDHPPVAFVGGSKYRSADGSGNNPFNEKLGASGTCKLTRFAATKVLALTRKI